jgi:hypothetical protein
VGMRRAMVRATRPSNTSARSNAEESHHPHSERLGEQRVLARLSTALEARLELALAGRDDEHTYVRLCAWDGLRVRKWTHTVRTSGTLHGTRPRSCSARSSCARCPGEQRAKTTR